MVKIEINDPEGLKADLMLVRSVLRDGGLPLELRYPISYLISKIQKAQNELLEGETNEV